MKTHNRKMHIGVAPEDATIPQPEHEIILEGRVNYEGQPQKHVRISTDAVTWPEVLAVMEDFLKGMGYIFDGHLDIVDEEA